MTSICKCETCLRVKAEISHTNPTIEELRERSAIGDLCPFCGERHPNYLTFENEKFCPFGAGLAEFHEPNPGHHVTTINPLERFGPQKWATTKETDMKENEKWAVLRCSVEDMEEIQKAVENRYQYKWIGGSKCEKCARIKTQIADLLTVEE